MDMYCPDCNTQLTESIVGYLCTNCGSSHSFAKVAEHPDAYSGKSQTPGDKNTPLNQKGRHSKPKLSNKTQSLKVPHTLKKMVVPTVVELPKPVPDDHLLEADYDDADISQDQTPLGKPTTPIPEDNFQVAQRSNKSQSSLQDIYHARFAGVESGRNPYQKTQRRNALITLLFAAILVVVVGALVFSAVVK